MFAIIYLIWLLIKLPFVLMIALFKLMFFPWFLFAPKKDEKKVEREIWFI